MIKEHKAIMLSTESKQYPVIAEHVFAENNKLEIWEELHEIPATLYYLYVLSDENIKKYDWFVYHGSYGKSVHKSTGNLVADTQGNNGMIKKIIATNDPRLTTILDDKDRPTADETKECYNGVPSIPQSFVEFYAKNPVDEVELQYDVFEEPTNDLNSENYFEIRLKLVNNEVVISKSIPKLYTKEEVKKLCEKYRDTGYTMSDERWFKENL